MSLVTKRSRKQFLENLDEFKWLCEEVEEKADHDLFVLLCEFVGNPLEDENGIGNVVDVAWL